MKKIVKILVALLSAIMLCFAFVACGDTNTPAPGPDPGKDNTIRDNDFLEDPNRRPDRLPFEDNTPLEEEGAVLKDYSFEFENAFYNGMTLNSKPVLHKCYANSFEFNPYFSGNLCMKNIVGGSSFTFTFESDKAVRSPMTMYVSNAYVGGGTLGSAYTMTVNGNPVVDTSVIVPSEGKIPPGANSYFEMVTIQTKISLAKGKNKLVIKSNTDSCPNMDGFVIHTSAEVADTTVGNWITEEISLADIFSVTTQPTLTEAGKISYKCIAEGLETHCPAVEKPTERALPAYNSGLYIEKDIESGTEFSVKMFGNELTVGSAAEKRYTITLQDGGSFADGSISGKVLQGAVPSLTYERPYGYMFVGWEDVNDATVYPEGFAMPEKDITIKPKFEKLTTKTLKLTNGAKFEDGTTQKSIMPFEEVTIMCDIPEGKVLTGWYDVSSHKDLGLSEVFTMPNFDVTVTPVFDVDESGYGPLDYTAVDEGKLRLYPKNGLSGPGAGGSSWRSDKMPEGGYLDSAKLGAVEKPDGSAELGAVYRLVGGNKQTGEKGQLSKGFFGMSQNPFKIIGNTKYTATVTVQNNGSDALELQFYATGSSGTPRPAGSGSEEVTLAPNETKTISFEFTFTEDNNNIMFVFDLLNDTPIDEMNIGMYVYVAKKV